MSESESEYRRNQVERNIKPSIDERCFDAQDQVFRLKNIAIGYQMQATYIVPFFLPPTHEQIYKKSWFEAESRKIHRLADLLQELVK